MPFTPVTAEAEFSFHPVFAIKDADTNIAAQLVYQAGQTVPSICIERPGEEASVIVSLADFRRMVAAVEGAL